MAITQFKDDLIGSIKIPSNREKQTFTSNLVAGLQLVVSWRGSAIRSRPTRESFNYNWYFRFQVPSTDKRSQIKIGQWPGMTSKQAEIEANRLWELARNGIDPRSTKLRDRAEKIDQAARESGLVPTKLRFEYVLEAMEKSWDLTGKTTGTMRKYRQALEKHAYPVFYGRNIKSITGNEWDELITSIANVKKMPGAANNTHKAGRRLFNYAVDQQLINYNPLLQRKLSLAATQLEADERFLEARDVHKFMNEIDKQPIPMRAIVNLKMMMQVGVRVDEWERVRIGWINFDRMRIEHPADSMKNRNAAWTHLPNATIEILIDWLNQLKEQFGPLEHDWYLFSSDESPRIAERTKLSDHTNDLKDWINFSPKLLRKTISTHLQRQGCPPAVLRAIRNQSVTEGVESHYDFDDLFHLKKQWIEKWADLLEQAKADPAALITDRDSQLDSSLSNQVANLFN